MTSYPKLVGVAILLTTLALLTVTAAAGQEWWHIEHSQQVVGNPWTTTRFMQLYDDGFLYQGLEPSPSYTKYYELTSSEPYNLFNNEGTLRILWIAAGLILILSLLWDMKLVGLLAGISVVVLGALSIAVFAFGIDDAVTGSDLGTLMGVQHVGFFGTETYEELVGTDTVAHRVSYTPGVGFWLTVIALSFQLIAAAIRTYMARESLIVARASRDMGKASEKD